MRNTRLGGDGRKVTCLRAVLGKRKNCKFMKIRFEFKAQDCWVGVFWKITPPGEPICHCGDPCKTHGYHTGHSPVPIPEPSQVDVWVCLLPCMAIHLFWLR